MQLFPCCSIFSVRGVSSAACAVVVLMACFSMAVSGQQPAQQPRIVQPGAPGQPTRTLPPTTRAKLPPFSQKDVEFMRGMIMHHAQAVEMTNMIATHTENKDLKLLGDRINKSQSSEIAFMKRWLEDHGQELPQPSASMMGMNMGGGKSQMMMPGMLTPQQMVELRSAKGDEFDRLFLKGMIQHHTGALAMVKDLFDTAGAGQDAQVFNFVTDVDSGQRAEIRIMETMLGEKP